MALRSTLKFTPLKYKDADGSIREVTLSEEQINQALELLRHIPKCDNPKCAIKAAKAAGDKRWDRRSAGKNQPGVCKAMQAFFDKFYEYVTGATKPTEIPACMIDQMESSWDQQDVQGDDRYDADIYDIAPRQ